MFNKITITSEERGLLFKDGSYSKYLKPGTYRLSPFGEQSIHKLKLREPFMVPGKDLDLFLLDEELRGDLQVVSVADNEYVLLYEDGRFQGLLTPGKYAFWTALKNHQFVSADIRQPELPEGVNRALLGHLVQYVQSFEVAYYEVGVLYYNNVLQRELAPGRYDFWRGPVKVAVKTVDLRQQQLDMTGQEMLTEDKVSLRLNFVGQYSIVSPLRMLQIKSLEEQIYISLQLALREYVGSLKLDELLRMKQEVGTFVLERLRQQSESYGVEFHSAGVKDIILPGEVKDILNTVLLAEKKAQANLITRREETASTRSLLNTAKLMDENQTLYRLKELEFLEKISEKIGNVSLVGGGTLSERLGQLLIDGGGKKEA
ncbi:slipin family protein [Paenibacillus donghaensis]|uniref:Peptidase n=1 Tax=Paenibacillus donghaensis TaxID=414771 RepID=A0A2Z2KYZ5_9BACL|nr:slipin family protein [Paenibacillus donghaensis]ASA25988.1 peptidase [Paenibacillus donghaensis]